MRQERLLYTKEAADESKLADIKMCQPCWLTQRKQNLTFLGTTGTQILFSLENSL